MSNINQNGWSEWSKHILKELERLNTNYESLSNKIDSFKLDVHEEISLLKTEIAKVKSMQQSLDDLKIWKHEYDNQGFSSSLKQLKDWKDDVDKVMTTRHMQKMVDAIQELQTFKTQAITIFLIAQALVGIAIALLKFF